MSPYYHPKKLKTTPKTHYNIEPKNTKPTSKIHYNIDQKYQKNTLKKNVLKTLTRLAYA